MVGSATQRDGASDASIEVVPDADNQRQRSWHSSYLIFGAVIAAGVVFRLWLGLGRLGQPDSDEAVSGLMALHFLRHGEIRAFYWGQPYGGSLEAMLNAPFFAVFGVNTLALKSVSLLLGFAASWLTWRIARHYFAKNIAAIAGCISLFWPATLVWYGTKERGFYSLTAALGLGAVLCAVNIDEHAKRWVLWALMGLIVGIGWWVSPNMVYYAPAIALWLAIRGHAREFRNIGIAAAATFLGALPWMLGALHSGFATSGPRSSNHHTYLFRFGYYFTHALPFAMGLRKAWTGDGKWIVGATFGALVTLVVVGLVVASFFVPAMRRRSVGWLRSPDILLIGASPFVYATFLQNHVLLEGRFVYFIASMLPLVVCRAMTLPAGRAVIVAIVAFTTISFVGYADHYESTIRPRTIGIANALNDAGYHTAIASYWIAYQMMYESDEHVVVQTRPYRYWPYVAEVQKSAPAYVFRRGDENDSDAVLLRQLAQRHIGYRIVTAGDYYAVLPASRFVQYKPVRNRG